MFNYKKFKTEFAQEYLLCFKMMFHWDKIYQGSEIAEEIYTELFNLCIQVMGSESYSYTAVKNSKIDNLLDVIYKIIDRTTAPFKPSHVLQNKILFAIRWVLMKRKSIINVFLNKESLKKMFSIVELVYEKRFELSYFKRNQININLQNHIIETMKFEVALISLFNEMMSQLISGNDLDIEAAYFSFMREL